jgi:beta-xylosidase
LRIKRQTRIIKIDCKQTRSNRESIRGVEVIKSKDLKNWQGPTSVFTVPENNWITGRVWAPEVHEYKGKKLLYSQLKQRYFQWKKETKRMGGLYVRGTQIFMRIRRKDRSSHSI